MTAVGLGQQGSQAVGPGFDIRSFLKYKGPPTKFFGTVRQKKFDGERDTPPPPIHKIFCIPKIF